MNEERLVTTVLGRDRFGTESAPTKFGVFDAIPLAGEQRFDVVVAFGLVGGQLVLWISVEGDACGAKA